MNEQLQLLVELQNLDTLIIANRKYIDTLPLKMSNLEKDLKFAQMAFDNAKDDLAVLEKKKRDKERNIKEIESKIEKLKSRSSEIKTNKEYQAYIKEVELMQQELSKVEDELLLIMESIDQSKKTIETKKSKVQEEEKRFEDHKNKLEIEKRDKLEEINLLQNKRQKLVSQLKDEIYQRYISLLKSTRGQAVVEVKDEICHGCNLHIPPQQYVEIKSNKEIHTCPQCGRFLYYKKPKEVSVS